MDLVSFAIIAALVAAGWWLLDFGFRSEQRARYGRHGANQPRYEIESSDIFARVFEPVERGACQLALLSPSGTSTSFTPVSLLPVELYVIKNGFADAWLPAQVLYEPIEIGGDEKRVTAPDPNYVVIRWLERLKEPRSPSGQWTKYYLWNLEPALAEALFDRA